MQIRFLLGPAGSGKTHRCLAEISDTLRCSPEGLPLILLAPKQATFQLERQLLTQAGLPGFTRLRILSFQRLAEFVLDQLNRPAAELLAEDGRLMVLRALIEKHREALRAFRSSARLPGFARQLSDLIRDLQQHRLHPDRIIALSKEVGAAGRVDAKLRDVAVLMRAYETWLRDHELEDADRLLDIASDSLSRRDPASGAGPLLLAGVWLDGFAQMTPQERRFLIALARCAESSTLAFCLDCAPGESPPRHSLWAPVADTFARCHGELSSLPGAIVSVETLSRDPVRGRFRSVSMLRHLEENWGGRWAQPFERQSEASESAGQIRINSCADPESEIISVAREIRRLVCDSQARYRDIAVLARSLESYHDLIRRIFARYEIPFFLDRREPVSHHPLAELTRYALRIAAFGWEHDDWFGALKTGLVDPDEAAIDRLENESLARGWHGREFWKQPISASIPAADRARLEELRSRVVPPFEFFVNRIAEAEWNPGGADLVLAMRELWRDLEIARTLDRWSGSMEEAPGRLNPAVHETVWEQLTGWLRNVELAFAQDRLPIKEWLPVVEAGLGNLTVGVVPPVLDQVLVGAIDRSRNPDLTHVFVVGMNEGVFPAPPPTPSLLTRSDRELLAAHNAPVGCDWLHLLGLERYYGYIACSRARLGLTVSFSERDREGRELNPSVFIDGIRGMFPSVKVESAIGEQGLTEAVHWTETVGPLLNQPLIAAHPVWQAAPGIHAVLEKAAALGEGNAEVRLPAELVEKIFGTELRTSVSGLEEFAACPFRFFVARGLRAQERMEFEADLREKGSFQHEILAAFHQSIQKDNLRWRDVSPREARQRIRAIGAELLPNYRDGLLVADQRRRFAAQILIESLERLVDTLVLWARHYGFDPAHVEISFGLDDSGLPGWRIDLDGRHSLVLRGRIDRVDLLLDEGRDEALAVVIDYKSSARELDPVLVHHGLELQLLSYLGVLSQLNGMDAVFSVRRLVPAGAFYVPLKNGMKPASTRVTDSVEAENERRSACQHRGRFDAAHLVKFDTSGAAKGEQFRFAINKSGELAAKGNEALRSQEFRALLDRTAEYLRQHGRNIFAGTIAVAPFRRKQKTACDFCDYRPVCRFDLREQAFRVLK